MNLTDEVLHVLLDVASGSRAILGPADALALHQKITPGYGVPVPSAEQIAAAEKLLADAKAAETPAAAEG